MNLAKYPQGYVKVMVTFIKGSGHDDDVMIPSGMSQSQSPQPSLIVSMQERQMNSQLSVLQKFFVWKQKPSVLLSPQRTTPSVGEVLPPSNFDCTLVDLV